LNNCFYIDLYKLFYTHKTTVQRSFNVNCRNNLSNYW